MKKVFFATARNVGEECIRWATNHTPTGFEIVSKIEHADVVFSIMYDKIISEDILKDKECFNFHPGILPDYKGVGIYSWVIINGEDKAGVTLHLIDRGVDTGDVIEIREFLISKKDTAFSLHQRGEKIIFKMFKDWYEDLLSGKYIAVPQNPHKGRIYRKKDLQKAMNLTRFAKAFHFPEKPPAFFINDASEKIYLNYSKKETKYNEKY